MVRAFIPARAGSRRLPNKNIVPFFGHPLMAYTIRAAISSGVFSEVYVSTDSEEYARIARAYGAASVMRPEELAQDDSPDYEWIAHMLQATGTGDFAVLRPTNPFRSVATIQGAANLFKSHPEVSEVRALRPSSEHPFKTWAVMGEYCLPVMENTGYLYPTQRLLPTFVQAAGIEVRRMDAPTTLTVPYLVSELEGLDINTSLDLAMAEHLVAVGLVDQPSITNYESYCH